MNYEPKALGLRAEEYKSAVVPAVTGSASAVRLNLAHPAAFVTVLY